MVVTSNLPAPFVYTAFFPSGGRGSSRQEKLAVYTDGAGRFEGPSPDTECRDVTIYIYLYTPQMRIGVRGWEKEGGEEEGGEEERMRWEEEGGEAR